ncbi:MAG: LysR family transcriptional regulator [Eubacterium sp.]|nr:LysR family transcriptional regulator [Eubacterium sp.]
MLNLYINTFIEAADSGSFSAAAEKLYLSKVSVMNQINALEARVGVPLFTRTHQGVILTEAGKAFYKNSKKLMRLSENAIREARKIGGKVSRNIRIGTSIMRPCNDLVELWESIDTGDTEYQFSIVPFNDDVDGLSLMASNLGEKIDCFVTPCGSTRLLMNYSFLPFGMCKCAVAMSRKHPLAGKEILNWDDLDGQTLLLMKRGDSYVLDEMRDDIICSHSKINIVDFDGYYDISAFNMCEQQGCLMETLDIWSNLHPSLVTIPVNWSYEMPYGILYEKEPSDVVKGFVGVISKAVDF